MLVDAPEIPALPEPADMGVLANAYIDLMELYGELRTRNAALIAYTRGSPDGKTP